MLQFFICDTCNANFKLLSRLSQYTSSVVPSAAPDKDLTPNSCMYQPDLCRASKSCF